MRCAPNRAARTATVSDLCSGCCWFLRCRFAVQFRSSPDRKSTRLNSSHLVISYAVFCLKKKKLTLLAHHFLGTSLVRDDPRATFRFHYTHLTQPPKTSLLSLCASCPHSNRLHTPSTANT